MTELDLLIAGRAIIADPKQWTQRWFARTKDGTQCYPDNPQATCFCSVGALGKVSPGQMALRNRAVSRLNQHAAPGGIVHVNDRGNHAEVLAIWDAAIASYQ